MLAAANPKFGRFDPEMGTLTSQIELPPALMSRFDLIFVMTDKPDKERDRNLTTHILNVHRRGEVMQLPEETVVKGINTKHIRDTTQSVKPHYDVELLRKYVAYSKRMVPVMSDDAMAAIQGSYLKIRDMGRENGNVTITARQLEALIRLSEASARMRLCRVVEESDAQKAVDLVEYYLSKLMSSDGGQWDMGAIDSAFVKKDRDKIKIMTNLIDLHSAPEGISKDEILKYASDQLTDSEVEKLLDTLTKNGTLYSPRNDVYKRA